MKTWTRLLSLLLCAALAFSLCVVGVSAASYSAGALGVSLSSIIVKMARKSAYAR